MVKLLKATASKCFGWLSGNGKKDYAWWVWYPTGMIPMRPENK